ncbi:MAG: GAF domain-containing protein [Herminiimonas sp.]|nr:GAF domain-containing protein [Herminiimonas sp.]
MAGAARQSDDFGPAIILALRAGDAIVVDNIALDPRSANCADACANICGCDDLALPLVKYGKLIAVLSLHENESLHWTGHARSGQNAGALVRMHFLLWS